MLKRSVLLNLCLVLIISAFAQSALNDSIPIAPEIRKGVLANGLTFYIRQNTRPEKKVELRLAVKVGSIVEDDDQQGLAHFTEHMAFNGTKHFKKNDLVSFLQSIGVEFGADLNASTGFDETIYILPIPTDKPDNLEKGFQALEDWASLVTFDTKEIDKERGVVLEESRLGKGADDRMSKVILPKLFEGSKYSDRLPIGKDEILKGFKPETIKRFYKDWYRPDLMAVFVVGDIDPALGEKMIRTHFEKLKNPLAPRKRIYANIPGRTKSEGVVVTDKEATNHVVQIYYSYEPVKLEVTLGDYRASIVKSLFNNMLNMRLQELTQKQDPPFLYGASTLSGFVQGYDVYSSFAVISNAGVEKAVEAVMQENERARKFGFTSAELDRVKKSFTRSLERAFNERDKTESVNYAEEYIRNFLENEPIPGIAKEFEYFKGFSEGITLEEINQFAAKSIPNQAAKLVIMSGPEQANFKLPTGAELLAIAEAAEKTNVNAYEEKALSASLMEKPPVPGKVVSEKTDKSLSLTELSLSNGMRVILKPTDFKNDQVLMGSFRFGGQSLYEQKDQFNASYAATLIGQMGVADFAPTELRKMMAGKTVGVSPRIGVLSEGVNGQSGSADVETMLQLVYLYLTRPRQDTSLFNSFISKQQAYLQNIRSDPEVVYQDTIQRVLYNNHPRAPRYPKPTDFDKIQIERVMSIYGDRLGHAAGLTFCFVGSFDLQKMKELVTTYLGAVPQGTASPGFKDLGVRPVKGVVKKEVQKGTEPKSQITMIFTGETPYLEDANLRLQALLEVVNIKLTETLREDLSGVYGAGVRGGLSQNPYNSYSITVGIPCGPENVSKLIAATWGEIKKIQEKGPLEADLAKVKENWLKQYREDLKENSYWLSKILQTAENGMPLNIMSGEQRIKAVTVTDLKDAAVKYFDERNYVQVILNPEK